MREHPLRNLEAEEKKAIEELMAEYQETHRTFDHLVAELEQLEAITRELEYAPDATSRMRLIKARGARQLAKNLNETLTRFIHDETELLRTSKHVRHRVAADIIKVLEQFSKHA